MSTNSAESFGGLERKPVEANVRETAIATTGISAGATLPALDRVFVPSRSVVFVIPAFNEAENIPRLFADLEEHPELFPPGSRVIMVDDGSSDGTPELIAMYDGWLPVELVKLEENQGPGAAFRAGFASVLAGSSDDALVVTLEADTTSDLAALPLMLERASLGDDLVLASVHGGGRMMNVGLLRRTLSKGAGVVVRLALGLDARTVSSFFRVYRASTLRVAVARYGDDLIREPGFACKAELLAKLSGLGARISEVPVDLDASRRVGKSKMRLVPTLRAYTRLIRQRPEAEPAPQAQGEAAPA
jgi:dolichol-phosphate mannosyltransferase